MVARYYDGLHPRPEGEPATIEELEEFLRWERWHEETYGEPPPEQLMGRTIDTLTVPDTYL